MKEQVKKFDLDAAFKALDEIECPKVRGMRPNRLDLTESCRRVDRLSMLVEDYYDVGDISDLAQAREDRDEDIAQAKLDRIERIVDLDADSAEDILPSYVGKNIIQCPNCLNLFYKDPADIEASDADPKLVNVGEICQHCGNDSGYTLIGKIAEDTSEVEEEPAEEIPAEEESAEENAEEETNEEEKSEEEEPDLEKIDLEEIPMPEEEENKEEEEEVKESLNNSELLKDIEKDNELKTENESENLTLNESCDDKEKCDELFNLKAPIDLNLNNLGGSGNNVDVLGTKADICEGEECKELFNVDIPVKVDAGELLGHNNNVNVMSGDLSESSQIEEAGATKAELDALLDSDEYKTDVSEAEVDKYLNDNEASEENLDELDDFDERMFDAKVNSYLTEVYSNVKDYATTDVSINNEMIVVEGVINFKSGKSKNTTFEFEKDHSQGFIGKNKDLAEGYAFYLTCADMKQTKTSVLTESFSYCYDINGNKVMG